jgi:hypothetical protein
MPLSFLFKEKFMHPVFHKTFGGLTRRYYLRHLFFASILLGIFLVADLTHNAPSYDRLLYIFVSTFLYPYSRFVYEGVVNFLLGGNVFFGDAVLFLAVKAVSMLLCWFLAIVIAPIGLLYLYFYHSKSR